MSDAELRFTFHAVERMQTRGIAVAEAITVLREGLLVARDREGTPRPSETRIGWVREGEARARLAVVSSVEANGDTLIITVFWPDPEKWNADFTKRLR